MSIIGIGELCIVVFMIKVTMNDLPWRIVDIDKAMNTINNV